MRQLLAFAVLTTLPLLAKVEDKETIRQTHAASRGLEVSIVSGKIRVMGGASSAIEVEAIKTVRADDQTALEQGKREVKLNMDTNGERLRVCEEGPYGGCDKKDQSCRGRDCNRDYSVSFDVTVKVPTGVTVKLRNVNGGIEATSVGAFDVKTVNGGARVIDASGSGSVHSVNGAIHLSFVTVPTSSVEVKTVNGAIEAAFPRNAGAELSFKTLHGGVFTNMPTEAINQTQEIKVEERNGMKRYRNDGHFSVRLGAGGPKHSFETVNGSIEIKERN